MIVQQSNHRGFIVFLVVVLLVSVFLTVWPISTSGYPPSETIPKLGERIEQSKPELTADTVNGFVIRLRLEWAIIFSLIVFILGLVVGMNLSRPNIVTY